MADFPIYRVTAPAVLTPAGIDSVGPCASGSMNIQPLITTPSSATWPSADKAYFYPFRLTDWAVAYQLLFWVGATSGNNIDVGIYDSQLNLVVSSGSTAMSATVSTVQELNITDTTLQPGDYLLGLAVNGTTGTCMRALVGNDELTLTNVPIYEQTSAFALPDPCAPVRCTDASPSIWLGGIQMVPTF